MVVFSAYFFLTDVHLREALFQSLHTEQEHHSQARRNGKEEKENLSEPTSLFFAAERSAGMI